MSFYVGKQLYLRMPKSKPPLSQSPFVVPYLILIASIIFLSVSSYVILHDALEDIKSDARMINLSSRQRMLSQGIVKDLMAISFLSPSWKGDLNSYIQQIRTVHDAILNGNEELGLKPLAETHRYAYEQSDFAFKQFNALIPDKRMFENQDSLARLVAKQKLYLASMDRFVLHLDQENSRAIVRFQHIELVLMLVSVTVIILEVVLIFIPAIRRINRQQSKLRRLAFEESHTMRHPLTNILGILKIINWESLSQRDVQYMRMLEKEASKIDETIKANAQLIYR